MSNFETIKTWLHQEMGNEKDEYVLCEKTLVQISSAIYQDRMSKSLNQTEYAKLLDVSQVMISKIENNNFNPTIEMLAKIATKLNFNFKVDFGPKTNLKCIPISNIIAYTNKNSNPYRVGYMKKTEDENNAPAA